MDDGRMDGWIDGRMDGWVMGGWMGESVNGGGGERYWLTHKFKSSAPLKGVLAGTRDMVWAQ